MYDLSDLEEAERNFEYWSDRWSKEYVSDKPNKYDADAKKAALHFKEVTEYLKANGTIPFTNDELAQESLDQKYPRAQSRDVEVHNGVRYQKRFYPKKRSKSGKTVKEWDSAWVNLDSPVVD